MTIKYLREILKHYTEQQYDEWEIKLWDYNNQREIEFLEGTYSSSKDTKTINFPVKAEPIDGETIDERIKRIIKETKKDN